MGAGAVGSLIGGLLAQTGSEIRLVGRGEHIQRIRYAGLQIDGVRGEVRVAISASENLATLAECDVVLVSVRLPDTITAIEAAMNYLSPKCVLVSLQNGVDGPRLIGEATGSDRIVAGVVMLGVSYLQPGIVTFSSDGFVAIGMATRGPLQALQTVAGLLESALRIEVVDDIWSALWAKVVINTDMPILALTGRKYPAGLLDPSIHRLALEAAQEGLGILDMASIGRPPTLVTSALEDKLALLRLPDDELRSKVNPETSAIVPSSLQGLLRGRRQETRYINGALVNLARSMGRSAPTNEALTYLAKRLELPAFDFLAPAELLDAVATSQGHQDL